MTAERPEALDPEGLTPHLPRHIAVLGLISLLTATTFGQFFLIDINARDRRLMRAERAGATCQKRLLTICSLCYRGPGNLRGGGRRGRVRHLSNCQRPPD